MRYSIASMKEMSLAGIPDPTTPNEVRMTYYHGGTPGCAPVTPSPPTTNVAITTTARGALPARKAKHTKASTHPHNTTRSMSPHTGCTPSTTPHCGGTATSTASNPSGNSPRPAKTPSRHGAATRRGSCPCSTGPLNSHTANAAASAANGPPLTSRHTPNAPPLSASKRRNWTGNSPAPDDYSRNGEPMTKIDTPALIEGLRQVVKDYVDLDEYPTADDWADATGAACSRTWRSTVSPPRSSGCWTTRQ